MGAPGVPISNAMEPNTPTDPLWTSVARGSAIDQATPVGAWKLSASADQAAEEKSAKDASAAFAGVTEMLGGAIQIGGLVLIWGLLGLLALLWSAKCFWVEGSSPTENMLGLLLAFFLGPLYWIYYGLSSTYCKPVVKRAAAGGR